MNRLCVLTLAVVVAAACSSTKHYEMNGQVLSVNRDKLEILVNHGDIPGLMPAMTMPYKVQAASMLDNIGAGDLISAQLEVDNNQAVVTTITKTGTAKVDTPPPAPVAQSGLELIKTGAKVPNQVLIDQDGRETRLSDLLRGHALALTFMYTKCPMPTFCPMMDRNFLEVQKQIKSKPELRDRVRLLSVSFDPKNDTAPVLKMHAKELGADPSLWTFVTGTPDDIDRFAMNFGVTLIRGESSDPNEIGHTLRTAIIDRDGKLVKVYTGNEWTPSDIVSDFERLP